MKGRTAEIIFDDFKSIFILYLQRGFHIQTVHADGEFEALKDLIQNMPADPRVNLKSGSHAFCHSLLFIRIPKLMTIQAILNIAKMLNYFPTKQGISSERSPCSILTGELLDYKKHLALQPGQYYKVHENEGPSNIDKTRTQGAICLETCGNPQGGFKFMSLQTGQKIKGYNWDEIPIPQTVINRVNVLGKDQPEYFIFTNRKGRQIGESEMTGVEGDQNLTPQILIE